MPSSSPSFLEAIAIGALLALVPVVVYYERRTSRALQQLLTQYAPPGTISGECSSFLLLPLSYILLPIFFFLLFTHGVFGGSIENVEVGGL